MSKTTIPTGGITADAINATKIADDAISEEHIDATAITAMTELAAEPADTDEFLISDAGTLKRIDYSHIKGGGGLTLLNHTNQTSDVSDVNIDNIFTTSHDSYIVIVRRFIPATDNKNMRMQIRTGGSSGSDNSETKYDFMAVGLTEANSSKTFGGDDQAHFFLTDDGENTEELGGSCAHLTIHTDHSDNAGNTLQYHGTVKSDDNNNNLQGFMVAGQFTDSTSDVTATGLRFFAGSGNVSKITVTVFGVNKS
tara:strand:- start:765 stop:1523 length:759 start_codon:yes stop_codon:yes gene_type:complete